MEYYATENIQTSPFPPEFVESLGFTDSTERFTHVGGTEEIK